MTFDDMLPFILLVAFIVGILSWARYTDYLEYKIKRAFLGLTGKTRIRKTSKGKRFEVQYIDKNNNLGFRKPTNEELRFLQLTKYIDYDTVV